MRISRRNDSVWSLNSHEIMSKLIPNSPILSNNHELRSIVVNKGRIHGQLRKIWIIFWNSVISDDEMWIEIRDFDIFGKKTRRKIHGIKNHWIWIKILEEIIGWTWEKFLKNKITKTEIEIKIDSNYDSKLKSKAIRRNIRMKKNP